MSLPEPELVLKLGLPRIIGIAAIESGILHALTTLMGFWTFSARVLYGAAQLNQLPEVFTRLNKHGQPTAAYLVVLGFSIFFCLFSGENWVQYIYAISSVAAGIIYIVTCLNATILRKKFPDWERPYKAPGGNGLFFIGILVDIWILIGSVLELNLGGYISLGIYIAVGIFLHLIMETRRRKNPEKNKLITLTPEDKDRFDSI